ncbi:MAG: DUF3263 domain-containing protein [Actinomycetota bacterium]|nr:DUF3263 domain-containing protein [Actinomycetota bacterium]
MLDSEDRAILEFERSWWMQPGAKDQAIEHSLGLTAAAYYDRLLEVIVNGNAFDHDPLTVLRVRSLIESSADRDMAV